MERMNVRHRVLLLCALGVPSCSSQEEPLLTSATPTPRSDVVFTADIWPGEGIPVIELRRTALPVLAEPDPSAAVVDTLRGRVGQRVTFDSTRYQTIESGSVAIQTSFTLTGRDLGDLKRLTLDRYYQPNVAEVSIPLTAPTTIDFLQYRAEGTCFVRVQGKVIDAQPCPGFGSESVSVVRDPVTRWWILVRGAGGVSGWILVSDTTARAVRREF
jgi:hypothetical protein